MNLNSSIPKLPSNLTRLRIESPKPHTIPQNLNIGFVQLFSVSPSIRRWRRTKLLSDDPTLALLNSIREVSSWSHFFLIIILPSEFDCRKGLSTLCRQFRTFRRKFLSSRQHFSSRFLGKPECSWYHLFLPKSHSQIVAQSRSLSLSPLV